MQLRQNVSLKQYSTMRLGGIAAYVTDIHDRNELNEAFTWARQQKLPVIMIGGGSNIFWRDEGFNGLVIVNKVMRFEEQNEDDENWYITVGAGENWDSVVERTVAKGLTGLEALSLIPGTAGATPVQNVGAYGQEISDTLVSVEAYDTKASQFVTIPTMDCGLGYRTSRFKTADHGRFFILGITLHLRHANPLPPFYSGLQTYFDEHGIAAYTPQTIRNAVIAIRKSKLPEPTEVPNNGSFFANPVVSSEQFIQIQADHPNIPHWQVGDMQVKIPAAWLLEQTGFKNMHDLQTGMATWPAQPLVLVNEHAQTTAQLLAFKQRIVNAVQQEFDVTLQQEPELLP